MLAKWLVELWLDKFPGVLGRKCWNASGLRGVVSQDRGLPQGDSKEISSRIGDSQCTECGLKSDH
jgi:hypothetical protein